MTKFRVSGENGTAILENFVNNGTLFSRNFSHMVAAFNPSESDFAMKASGSDNRSDFRNEVNRIRKEYHLSYDENDLDGEGYFSSMFENQ